MKSIKNKDKIYKRLLKSKNYQQKEKLYNKFKRYRNGINILTRNYQLSKSKSLSIFFAKNINKICLKYWADIKSITKINTTKNKSFNCLKVNDTKETDPFVLSSSFNKFFINNCQKIASNIIHHRKTTQIILQIQMVSYATFQNLLKINYCR